MSRPGALATAPPADRDALLAEVAPFRAAIFHQVRQVLDELEATTPWSLLYDPPETSGQLRQLIQGLVGLVDGIPARLGQQLDDLRRKAGPQDRVSLEEAEFFYSGIHRMVEPDLARLRERSQLLDRLDDAEAVPAAERNQMGEAAADLKGKYASALMGATASIVGEGRWDGVAVEPVLFPEKQQEFDRNEALVESLRVVLESLRGLGTTADLRELAARWSQGRRVDRHALADLVVLRGRLGVLLKRENRRALYSGDFHEIQAQEERFAERLFELEELHRRSWMLTETGDRYATEVFSRLRILVLEIAALLDVDLLEQIHGAATIRRLRSLATAAARPGGSPPPVDLPSELASVAPLLAREDLATFLELLHGAVLKRASFAPVGELTVGPAADELDETLRFRLEEVAPTPVAEEEPAPATPPAPDVAATQTREGRREEAKRALPAEERAAALRELNQEVRRLRSAANPDWRAVQMLQRLLSKHSRVPPSMVEAVHPFLYEAMNTLVPRLEAVSQFGGVPADTGQKLVRHCLKICESHPDPQQMDSEIPRHLQRIDRLFDALSSATAAQLKALES